MCWCCMMPKNNQITSIVENSDKSLCDMLNLTIKMEVLYCNMWKSHLFERIVH